eukprot:g7120.t1
MAVWLWPSIAAWLLRSCLGDGPGDGGRGQARGQPGQASIAAGAYCSFAIGADGELYGWGKNEFGKLGLGDEEDRLIPSKLNLRATAITAGRHHAVAIDESGRLWTWGSNQNGQLGAGDEVQSLALPHELFASGATQVASGARHNLAVVHGQLYSWGWNSNGQLGRSADGALRLPPADQSLWAWGTNGKGQMGTGQADHGSHTPVQILASGVTSIAAMDETSFAVYDGFLFGWGSNDKGQLGLGDVEDRAAPTEISRIMTRNHGIVYAWGLNGAGQLALGDRFDRSRPGRDTQLPWPVEVMAGGLAHSLLLYEDQSLWAVGHDAHGGLGSRLGGDFATTPVQVFEAGAIRPFNRSAFAFAPGRQKIGLSMVCGYMTKLAQQTIIPLRLYLFGAMLLRQSASSNTAGPAGRSQDPCGMLKGLNAQLRFRILRGDETAWAEVARSAEGRDLPDIAAGALSRGLPIPKKMAEELLEYCFSADLPLLALRGTSESGTTIHHARAVFRFWLQKLLALRSVTLDRAMSRLALWFTLCSAVSATLTFEHLGSTWTIHAHDNELHMAGADVFTFGHHQGTDLPDCPMTCGTGCGCGCGTRRLSAPKTENPFIPRVRDLKIQLPKPFTTPGAAHKLDQDCDVALRFQEGMTWLFDNCGGHGDTYGHYHYHAPPLCLLKSLGVPVPKKSAWWKSAGAAAWPEHGPEVQIGWALDGAPIMGPFKGGVRTEKKLLDECHGAFDELTGEYRYYLLPSAPYMPPCLRGAQLGNDTQYYVLLTVGQSIKVGYHGNSRTQTLVCVSTLSTKGECKLASDWTGPPGDQSIQMSSSTLSLFGVPLLLALARVM